MRKILFVLCFLAYAVCGYAEEYWKVDSTGRCIVWHVEPGTAHADHLEMAGKQVAAVLRYGVWEDGSFHIEKSMVWPMLRTIPNDTHASLMRRFPWDVMKSVFVNGQLIRERVREIRFDGTLQVESEIHDGVMLQRVYFPSTDRPALVELYRLKNVGECAVTVEWPSVDMRTQTPAEQGVYGIYQMRLQTDGASTFRLHPGEEKSFSASIAACRQDEVCAEGVSAEEEWNLRMEKVRGWTDALVLETPDPVIDCMFAFSKLRACESIYETKGGPMHGPGGETYYAAIWANDQAEYANPFFPFVGDAYANLSAENSFRHFARYMNPEWKPIPSSIIAEGDSYWNGAGDRGDAAMIAYGAARYALARGDRDAAEQLWPLMEWCLEYCRRKLNAEGVVASDADELEHRFPSGKANLCTSSLYYDALLSAAYLADELGKGKDVVKTYRRQASLLAENMEKYFAGPVEGFDTYRYYEGNDVLRSWICIPLTVGIFDKAHGTVEALFSPRLWTENGLLTQAGDHTFWDRSTLYALRGVLQAGEVEHAMDYLSRYSRTRLLGEHVPYAVEAWPEGGQRHLSAESALYARIVTEGLFGIRPVGLHAFELMPRLPQGWERMALRKIKAFGSSFDIVVERASGSSQLTVTVRCGDRIVVQRRVANGKKLRVML